MKSVFFSDVEKIYEFIKDEKNNVELLGCIFSNLLGQFYKCFFYSHEIGLNSLKNGFSFDASSIKLCSHTENSDFLIKLDCEKCFLEKSDGKYILNVICDIKRYNGLCYDKCPRTILKKACSYIKEQGVADTVYIGNELEFLIFDKVNYNITDYNSFVTIFDGESISCRNNAPEVIKGNKKNNNSNYFSNNCGSKIESSDFDLSFNNYCITNDDGKKMKKKNAYFSTYPYDKSNVVKHQISRSLNNINIYVERYHHEVSVGQHELSLKYADALKNADNIFLAKHIIKNVVCNFNRTVTFMPKPLSNDNGSGLHCNISLWKNNKNIFYNDNSSTFFLSKDCFYFMNGLVKHAKALQAFCNSTMNSYKRLVPGFETCQKLFYSFGSRNAVIRLPLINYNIPGDKRIEFRLPDFANSPHLVAAAIILAGYDGIKSKEQPLVPFEYKDNKFFIPIMFFNYVTNPEKFKTLNYSLSDYSLTENINDSPEFHNFFKCEEPDNISFSLAESLDALENDHAFLTVDNIFTKEMIQEYIEYKKQEILEYSKRVSAQDFYLYYDC